MDPSLYKTLTVPRRLTYNYYFSPAKEGKSTLLFLHGFPASSFDWRVQVSFFQERGYGIIAPDLLGSGKSSHPQDVATFRMKYMGEDVMSILDNEKVDKVVAIGHDWGCGFLSHLVLFHKERFSGSAWLCVPFLSPEAFDFSAMNAQLKDMVGYEPYAYWDYFIKGSTPPEVCQNVESFMQLLYAKSPEFWRTSMVVPGKTEEWVKSDTRPGRPDYLTDAEFDRICEDFVASGASALCWYKSYASSDINDEDNLSIPQEEWILKYPTLFLGAKNDYVCVITAGKMSMKQYSTDLTIEEMDTGHWIHTERPQEVNNTILRWLEAKNVRGKGENRARDVAFLNNIEITD